MNFKRKIKINDRFIIPIFIASFIIIIILLFEYGNIISKNVKYKKFAKENVQVFENNKEQVFKVEKILICSSANAIDLSEKQNLQDMSIYQYTDIAVYINNGEELTNKNTIKKKRGGIKIPPLILSPSLNQMFAGHFAYMVQQCNNSYNKCYRISNRYTPPYSIGSKKTRQYQ